MAPPDGPASPAPGDRLDSWKEIAVHLNRGLSTVQRWERDEGLPVHRLLHGKGGSVFAFRGELDAWWASRGPILDPPDAAGAPDVAPPGTPQVAVRTRRPAGLAVAAILVVAGLAGAAGLRWWPGPAAPMPPSPPVTQRLVLPLPADFPLAPVSRMPLAVDKPVLAISPDGRTLVYSATHDGRVQLVVYDMDARTAMPLAGTDAAHTPFFSPDGTRLGFFARGRLWISESSGGGSPTAVADVSNGWGAAWDTDGSIYFTPIEESGVMRLDPATGRITTAVSSTGYMAEPLSPGGGLLISVGGQTALASNGAMVRQLFAGISARRFQADYLLYALPGKLMAVPFDSRQVLVTGRALVVAGDLRTGPYGVAQFAVAREGTVVYAPGRDTLFAHFVRVTADGRRTRLGLPEGRYQEFSVSSDGTRLAATLMGDTPERMAELLVFDLAHAGTEGAVARAIPLPEPTGQALPGWPKWDVDGQHLFYALRSPTSAGMKLLRSRPDGSERHVVWQSDGASLRWLYPMSFSPDGRHLAVFGPSPGSRMDLFVLPVRAADGSVLANQTPVPYIATPALESFPQFSPDGTSIAYASDTSGRYEVYIAAYPSPGTPCRASHDGGMDPTWTQGGREIVYQSETAFYARTIESLADCRFGPPRLLFDGFPDRPGFGHDVLPGHAWLMLERDDFSRPTTSLNVVTNLADVLQRRVPAKAAQR